jgi:deoxyribonuclease-4
MSIAGGYDRAVERAAAIGCDCVQIFTANNLQWARRRVGRQEAEKFQDALRRFQIYSPLAHANYLINVASPNKRLWQRSQRALTAELRRAAALGIAWVVLHPGSATDGDLASAIARVVCALDRSFAALPAELPVGCLLENTAGQGNQIGSRLEELEAVLEQSAFAERLGICLDTCHLFAAGYPLFPREEYERTIEEIERRVGFARVKAIHLNDSKGKFSSRLDRHAHIGQGALGLEAFRLIVNDPRFSSRPMYIETPKETIDGQDMDAVNLQVLRSLVEQ